jgi:hypothetical protein
VAIIPHKIGDIMRHALNFEHFPELDLASVAVENPIQLDNEPEPLTKKELNRAEDTFKGYHNTSREFARYISKYKPKTTTDIHDLLSDEVSEELHFFLQHKCNVSNINSDNIIYNPAYKRLVEDLTLYLNIEE